MKLDIACLLLFSFVWKSVHETQKSVWDSSLKNVRSRFTHFITICFCPAEYNLSAVPLSPITLAEMEIIENSYKENTLLYLTKDWLFSDFMIYLSLTNNSWLPIVLAHVVLYIFTHSDSGKAGYSLIMHYCQWMFMLFLCLQGTE